MTMIQGSRATRGIELADFEAVIVVVSGSLDRWCNSRRRDIGGNDGCKGLPYERDAPTKVGATHTPSLVRILCTDFVTGFIHAASWVSKVVKPG